MAKEKMKAPIEVPALLWKRIAAFFIDMIIVYAIVFLSFGSLLEGAIPSGASFSETVDLLMHPDSIFSSVSTIFSLLLLLYFYLLEKRFGQSIGKMALGLHVISLEETHIGFWRRIGRVMFLIPIFPFMFLWMIDPLFMFFNKDHQRLSELLTKTQVVSYEPHPKKQSVDIPHYQ